MVWFKADDQLSRSKKVLMIPRRYRMQSMGLWILAGTWSAGELTDGFVPSHMLDELGGTAAQAKRLVESGLWSEVAGGFQFNSWSDFQPSSNDVRARRARDAERKQKAREEKRRRSMQAADQGGSEGVRADAERTDRGVHAESTRSPQSVRSTRPDPTRPDPTITLTGNKHMSETSSDGQGKPKRFSYPAEFESWWRAYPRHRNASKKQALESWRKATKQIPPAELQSLTERYAATHGIPDESKIPHPTTWLNQCRWETVDATDKPAEPQRVIDGTRPEDWAIRRGEPMSEMARNIDRLFGRPADVIDGEFWEEEPKEIR